MGINPQAGPPGGEARIAEAFSALTDGPPNMFDAELGGGAPAAQIRRPLPIFSVDLGRLRDEGLDALAGATRTGWRYLIQHGSGMNVMDLPEGGGNAPEMLTGGGVADNLVRTGKTAERIARNDADYEPRILDLNLIGDSVLWLHSKDANVADRFVSLGAKPTEVGAAALVERLRTAAERKLTAMGAAGDEAGG
jgi:hypothetical protein